MNSRLIAITRKEFIHILRDPRTLTVMFLIPVVQLVLLGLSATSDIRHLNTGVYDADRSAQSRALIEAYRASDYFALNYFVGSERELGEMLDRGDIRAAMIIPAGYADQLVRGETAQVAFLLDGSDPAVAGTANAAAQAVGQAQSTRVIQQKLGVDVTQLGGIEIRPRVWYNPELKSANYMIPALIGLILQFITILFTAQTIVREREQGTIEQLVVTPIRSWELIVGKMIPYIGIAFFNLTEILVLGVLFFGVPIRGSLGLLFATSFLFLLTTLGLGIFISTVAKSQQEAMLITFMLNLPGIFLSGFFFPLEAMPLPLQFLSYFIPLRYMLIILRGIVLKGVGLEPILSPVVALAIFGLVILVGASLRFRKSLE
jgi:ABC-2 type transport system permease protein